MAGKKKEGLASLKDTAGGNRRDDRQAANKTVFESITIDAKNALTVVHMLKSPEDNVVLKAVASLEVYARKGKENLKFLSSLDIFEYLIPLVHHNDVLIKRFSQKLIGMLCSLEEFREQMFTIENILQKFVDILDKETDVVMHEYSALTLAELSSDCWAASELLKVTNCIETLFLRITSLDPDVEKNCLDVMNHLLNDVNGIEAFVESSGFDIKLLLDLIPSSYPVIQVLGLEILKKLTSWCRDSCVLVAFKEASGIEVTLEVLENEEWSDLHSLALDLLIEVVDNSDMCDYLLQSGCLLRLINLSDKTEDKIFLEKIIGVFARMAQTRKGRLALHALEMDTRFSKYVHDDSDFIQESACLGIANLAQYCPCLSNIMEENPVPRLLDIIINTDKTSSLRNLASYALNVLCNEEQKASETLTEHDKFESLFQILFDCENLQVELVENVIQIFIGISLYEKLRQKIISENFMEALMSCIQDYDYSSMKNASIQVDALECLSAYLIEWEARSIFESLDGARKLTDCLRSPYAAVREWAGHLVVQASQNKDFVKSFIKQKGLVWLIEEKNTRYSMPSWESAIEAIFANFLPAKFAYKSRLDFQDITEDGFYISSLPRGKFCLVEEFLEAKISPILPVYVANFNLLPSSSSSTTEGVFGKKLVETKESTETANVVKEDQNLQKFMKGADRNSLEMTSWTGSLNTYPSLDYSDFIPTNLDFPDRFDTFIPDPFLNEHLENLKKRIYKEEGSLGDVPWLCIHPKLICERTKIIAEFVADEMAGSNPGMKCTRLSKDMHINQLKYQLGTNIIPLGFIRVGDYLERALLFKILADRIGFPCALVRGSYGRAWIEISIPVLNIEDTSTGSIETLKNPSASGSELILDSEETVKTIESLLDNTNFNSFVPEDPWFPKVRLECFKGFPNYFLKPNAIVDLVEKPGRILKINSTEADEYCGLLLFNTNY